MGLLGNTCDLNGDGKLNPIEVALEMVILDELTKEDDDED